MFFLWMNECRFDNNIIYFKNTQIIKTNSNFHIEANDKITLDIIKVFLQKFGAFK